MDIERTIDINAPYAQVWAIMADVERWPEWTASIKSVDLLEQGFFTSGSRARVRQPRLPTAVWTVTALQPDRSFEWQNASPGLKSRAVHSVESTGPDTSRVTLSIDWSGPLAPIIRLLYGGLSRRYVDTEASGLKRRAEASQTPPVTP
ncbi:MAG: SRPBCC family protein [Chloroflexi bacterium]|nr:SRPBCC family protein [Chloroflexota bacterium]